MASNERLKEFINSLTDDEANKILSALVDKYAKQNGVSVKYIITTKGENANV